MYVSVRHRGVLKRANRDQWGKPCINQPRLGFTDCVAVPRATWSGGDRQVTGEPSIEVRGPLQPRAPYEGYVGKASWRQPSRRRCGLEALQQDIGMGFLRRGLDYARCHCIPAHKRGAPTGSPRSTRQVIAPDFLQHFSRCSVLGSLHALLAPFICLFVCSTSTDIQYPFGPIRTPTISTCSPQPSLRTAQNQSRPRDLQLAAQFPSASRPSF